MEAGAVLGIDNFRTSTSLLSDSPASYETEGTDE